MDSRPLALAAVLALALVPAADALYILTPLTLTAGDDHAEVGDALDLEIGPNAEHENASAWAGRTVRLTYSWDPAEGTERSGGPEDEPAWEVRDAGEVELDGDVRGSLRWTVPEEVDDRNVVLAVVSEQGEHLARFDLRVGDAEQLYRLAAGSGAAGGEPVPVEDERGVPEEVQQDARDTPAAGVLAAVVAAAAAVLVARRR